MLPPDDLADDATELSLPSLEALLAGAMALMTAWASPCPDAKVDPQVLRRLLARKVQSNLFILRNHPHISPALCHVVQQMHPTWEALAGTAAQQEFVQAMERGAQLHAAPPQHGPQPVVLH